MSKTLFEDPSVMKFRYKLPSGQYLYSFTNKGKDRLGWFFSNIGGQCESVERMYPNKPEYIEDAIFEGDSVEYQTLGALNNVLQGKVCLTDKDIWVVWNGRSHPRLLADVYNLKNTEESIDER